MADDVMRRTAANAEQPPPGSVPAALPRPESRADRARRLVYRGRFAFFYLALAVVAGCAIGALVVLVGRGSPAAAPEWSAFRPEGSLERRAALIGDHVSDQYRLPSGSPLATVTYSGPPTIANQDGSALQVRGLAVQSEAASGADDVDVFRAESNVMYVLCGRGPVCAIPEGRDSEERTQLLRREALELALYSFTFLEGIDSVLILLPPRQGSDQSNVVFLERDDLSAALDKPLDETLTAELTPGVGEITVSEGQNIDRLTRSRVYQAGPLQQQDGSFIMVLAPALN